ncbi:MAG: hypothetical protein HY016_07900 [Nitrosomonadales bacterium]|nr:hypothetical protein [Nitrosomonadales bacterium]
MKHVMLFLLALIVVPAWAADAAPAPAKEPAAQSAQPAAQHKAKKTRKAKKKQAAPTVATTAAACYQLTCGGVTGCFYKGCTGSCTGC